MFVTLAASQDEWGFNYEWHFLFKTCVLRRGEQSIRWKGEGPRDKTHWVTELHLYTDFECSWSMTKFLHLKKYSKFVLLTQFSALSHFRLIISNWLSSHRISNLFPLLFTDWNEKDGRDGFVFSIFKNTERKVLLLLGIFAKNTKEMLLTTVHHTWNYSHNYSLTKAGKISLGKLSAFIPRV